MQEAVETKTEEVTPDAVNAKVSKKTAKPADNNTKTKLFLTTPPEHPLSNLQQVLRDRGVKNFDINDVVLEALDQVPEHWWVQKLEDLTPLEYRVSAALADPDLREKLTALLVPNKNDRD